ncbi:D-alanyl-D-alanine carboxypeptidase (penicillin-binding protein 5/6) [Motilibacter rhizosphaerae]|uniref:D-alanyl-D-alanine carboxypeptidase (Penicillin-binding protein 5/6) n=1 Tax=Motilibacter rhizosphaerae TaxID=598652 RepID=A0A4Q7NFX7_9ACTN|nr:D-alanyl-D-alanine carboxypeptidase [Motilibacter rhizosphaerae]RZS82699.1 D-alanyl-D-alanine carboxypeptidase (penicillin-binding protein 5/6) [Motilibacter rhizosphaerae]
MTPPATSVHTPPRPYSPGRTVAQPRRRRAGGRLLVISLVAALLVGLGLVRLGHAGTGGPVSGFAWPQDGQAAMVVGGRSAGTSGDQRAVPVASVAKVMTAYVVLREHPLGSRAPAVVITRADVADTVRRRARGESVLQLREGQRLTERQALLAVLLPSANNVAVALARSTAGSTDAFVARMNAEARRLGMRHTTYTDPSGYDPSTVSTAADQLRLVRAAMAVPAFAELVRQPTAVIPGAGTVRNTDVLLGRDGFVGVKTGSDRAAGGCFAFAAWRSVSGRRVLVLGVVLGQQGKSLVQAGQDAARRLVLSVPG